MRPFRSRIAAIALSLFASSAWAVPVHIQASGVTFDSDLSGAEALLSDNAGAAVFSLPGIESALSALAIDDTGSRSYSGSITLSARTGYRVTGYSLKGTFNGTLQVGQSPTETIPGSANNSVSLTLEGEELVTANPRPQQGTSLFDLDHEDGFLFEDSGFSSLTGLLLWINGSTEVSAVPAFEAGSGADTTDTYYSSLAGIDLSSLLLTVYTEADASAVPEPAGFGLVGAGLG
ncbi:MAG: hypothetical protein ACLGI6_01420, partial [Gammaproteobacteria bacterium]